MAHNNAQLDVLYRCVGCTLAKATICKKYHISKNQLLERLVIEFNTHLIKNIMKLIQTARLDMSTKIAANMLKLSR